MDQTYIMDDVKEKCCYVSSVFKADMELSRYVPRSNDPMPLPRVFVRADGVTVVGLNGRVIPLSSNTSSQTFLSIGRGDCSSVVKPSMMRHGRFWK